MIEETKKLMEKQKVQSFQDLKVWQKAHSLVLEIYKITQGFPSEERFGLISQLRRSVVSISANIVEGHSRKTRKDFAHFLDIARGSLEETKYFLILSKDLGYFSDGVYEDLVSRSSEIGRMLYSFQKNLSLNA